VGVVLACNNYEIIDLGVMVPTDKILQTAIDIGADVIGVSGLMTPSLDEMVGVAKEMERLKFTIPLLIGGATTSRAHTAVKIDQNYSGPVVHVLDASRSVPVVGNLLQPEQKEEYARKIKAEYVELRETYANRKKDRNYLSLEAARANKFKIDWSPDEVHTPKFIGTKVFEDYPLSEIQNYIDWTPFFQAWELHGKYPKILSDAVVGEYTKYCLGRFCRAPRKRHRRLHRGLCGNCRYWH
jgi:5-methyltetrahydrofolate--homocysteine methyltransferase